MFANYSFFFSLYLFLAINYLLNFPGYTRSFSARCLFCMFNRGRRCLFLVGFSHVLCRPFGQTSPYFLRNCFFNVLFFCNPSSVLRFPLSKSFMSWVFVCLQKFIFWLSRHTHTLLVHFCCGVLSLFVLDPGAVSHCLFLISISLQLAIPPCQFSNISGCSFSGPKIFPPGNPLKLDFVFVGQSV